MAGPLPLPIEHNPSSYGDEVDVQRNIASAAQYNPATKLGITAGDQPSKKATTGGPTTAQTLAPAIKQAPQAQPVQQTASPSPKRSFGPKSGFEGDIQHTIKTLALHPAAGPEVHWYANE